MNYQTSLPAHIWAATDFIESVANNDNLDVNDEFALITGHAIGMVPTFVTLLNELYLIGVELNELGLIEGVEKSEITFNALNFMASEHKVKHDVVLANFPAGQILY
jgi:hypothetical protein